MAEAYINTTEPEIETISIGNKRIEAKFNFEKGIEATPYNLNNVVHYSPKRILPLFDRWMSKNAYECFIHTTEEELDKLFASLKPFNGQRMKKEKLILSNHKAGTTEDSFTFYNIKGTFYSRDVDKYIKRIGKVLVYYMEETKNYPIWIKFKKNWFFGMSPIILRKDIEILNFP